MSRVAELLRSRRVPHFAVLALMSVGFAGCSADMSSRVSQNYSNPFASEPQATGSVPTPAVERRELPQYARPQTQYQQQYPILLNKSGTRREELLLKPEILQKSWILRKLLYSMDEIEAMEFILEKMKATKNNNDFFDMMRRGG